MHGPRLPAAGARRDLLGILPRDAGWVRRYILAELLERPRSARVAPRRGPRPLPPGAPRPPGPRPGHQKL